MTMQQIHGILIRLRMQAFAEGDKPMKKPMYLGRNISIMYRQSNRFYDRVLAPYQIGCGQQFFLLRIYENQGISMLDLARLGQFDKGTVTRAAQKLEEQGYVRSEPDEKDRRVRRLYTTDAVEPIAQAVYEARTRWNDILLDGMSDEEIAAANILLEKMAKNAFACMEQEDHE